LKDKDSYVQWSAALALDIIGIPRHERL